MLVFFGPLVAIGWALQAVILDDLEKRAASAQSAYETALTLREALIARIESEGAATIEAVSPIALWTGAVPSAVEADLRDSVFAALEDNSIELERYSTSTRKGDDDLVRISMEIEFEASLYDTVAFLDQAFAHEGGLSSDRLSIRPARRTEQVDGQTQVQIKTRLFGFAEMVN